MAKRLRMNSISVDVVAVDRMVLVSPRKVNLVAAMIRGMNVDKALAALKFSKKSVAVDVAKVLRSAISNAEMNFGLDVSKLCVKEAYVGKALTLKRFLPRAKGSGSPMRKMFSRLTIVLCETEV